MIGILAYGSLLDDPGVEIEAAILQRIAMQTPFPVEFARSSRSRGGAPTLAPVTSGGAMVAGVLIVLSDNIAFDDAASMLWRRETRQVGSHVSYVPPQTPGSNSVLVNRISQGDKTILYTDFHSTGKISNPTPQLLATLAVTSAKDPNVPEGRDGITYLINAKKAGIITPLMADYEKHILQITAAPTLSDTLEKLRPQQSPQPKDSPQI
jgi:hypothetical protein